MSTFIDLDSTFRDRDIYPNENRYELLPSQVESWFSNRTTSMIPQCLPRVIDFVTTVEIVKLTIPYNADIVEFARIYVSFGSLSYKDRHLINTINGVHPYDNFVCFLDNIQMDRNNEPLWMHYTCDMAQVMRVDRNATIFFELSSRDGSTLGQQDTPPDEIFDPLKQTMCTIRLTSYINNGNFSNQEIEPLNY